MKADRCLYIIRRTTGRPFKVKFTKKDGSVRDMLCSYDEELKTISPRYEPLLRGMICVWDLDKEDYRTVTLESIIEIEFGKYVYFFP